MRWMMLFLLTPGLTSCLITRAQLREDGRPLTAKDQANKVKADQLAEEEAREERERQNQGRLEALEHELTTLRQSRSASENEKDQKILDLEQKLKAYEEAVKGLESQQVALNAEIAGLKAAQTVKKAEPSPVATAETLKGGNFVQAEADFAQKRWREAIAGYQKYREMNPTGRRYSMATYKMGVSFQELGMKEEARSFYQEVLEKFPGSSSAEKAKYRLSTLK